MTVLQWKNLAVCRDKQVSMPKLIASVVPIEAPHLQDIPPELLFILERLQLAIHLGEFQGEKITLPPGCMALIYKQSEIASVYQKQVGLGEWLQKSHPWERGNVLVVADMANFPVSCCIPGREQRGFFIRFQMEISLKWDKAALLVRDWLRFHRNLTSEDVADLVADALASMNFLYYLTPKLLQSAEKRRQIEKKACLKITEHLNQYGLAIKSFAIRGEHRKESRDSLENPSKNSRAESIVEAIEERRLRQSLRNIHYSDAKKTPSAITAKITKIQAAPAIEAILPSRSLPNKTTASNLTAKIVVNREKLNVEPILPPRVSTEKQNSPTRIYPKINFRMDSSKSGNNIEKNIENKRSRRMKKMALEEIDGN